MTKIIDNVTTLKILSLITRPIVKSKAYRLGIVDEEGNNLIKSKDFTNSEQRDAYTLLDRLVFNIKKLINKLPGKENKIKNLLSAYYLVKESYYAESEMFIESDLEYVVENITTLLSVDEILLAEEMAANNASGGGVSGLGPNDVAVKKDKKSIILKRYKIPELDTKI